MKTLTKLAEQSPYSAEYLSLRARQGKLKAKKIKNKWYSTKNLLDRYAKVQRIKKLFNELI